MTNGDKDNFALLRYLLSSPESIPQKLRIRGRIFTRWDPNHSNPRQHSSTCERMQKEKKNKEKINEKWEKVVGQRSIERKSIYVSYAEEA